MKILSLISIAVLIPSLQLSAQKVITVDNNAGAVAQYSNLADAITDAEANDTILIAGSPDGYGTHNIYKRLHFVGVGYFLDENEIPGLNTHSSKCTLNFKQDNSLGDSSGSSATGLQGGLNSDAGASDIVIDKCFDGTTTWHFNGKVTITRVFHQNTIRMDAADSTLSNTIVSSVRATDSGDVTITNCVIRNDINVTTGVGFANCILVSDNPTHFDGDGNYAFCMNIGASHLPGGSNNINNVLLTNVFTLTGGNAAVDRYWTLKIGSAAEGVGLDGVDMGAFGEPDPYVLSGVPGRPRLTRFGVSPIATGESPLAVEIESEAFAE